MTIGVTAVHNPDFEQGMFSSLKAGIASLPDWVTGCLILPVDVPLLRVSTIQRVMHAAAQSGVAVVNPAFHGLRGHPPYVGRPLFAEILQGDGQGGLRAILWSHEKQAREVAVFNAGCLSDMDTQEDYNRLLAVLARHHLPDVAECEAMFDAAATIDPVRRHGRAVAMFAKAMADRLTAAGVALDAELVKAAALVHDMAKGRPHHAEAGAEMLREFGFPQVADVVAQHMSISFNGVLNEAAVLYLADKLIQGDEHVSLEERFASAFERFADDPAALAGALRWFADAEAILRAVEARIGPLSDASQTAPGARLETANDLL
jgi:molybdenum cofactor cytidylyltransferase